MTALPYSLIRTEEGESFISVYFEGKLYPAASSHPNFDAIVEGAFDGDESIIELFDISLTAAKKFDRLSERVTVAYGRLYLDGEEVHNSLANQVVRFIEEGVDNWIPLVAFFENVQSNPQEHSREQLFAWLDSKEFTITEDGLIVGYKGVTAPDSDGVYRSIHSGKAIVNGEVINGQIPQKFGDVVEMPRGEVQHDPSVGCHRGLHVGTYEYASTFGQGALLEVHVNPRDVVSVPTDSSAAKIRCCRYTVIDTIDQPYTTAIKPYDYADDYGWGDGEFGDDEDDDDGYDFFVLTV